MANTENLVEIGRVGVMRMGKHTMYLLIPKVLRRDIDPDRDEFIVLRAPGSTDIVLRKVEEETGG